MHLKLNGKILAWTGHRTNHSIAEELGVMSGTPLTFKKNKKSSYFGHTSTANTGEMILGVRPKT